jgi:cyclophilin family peptidyl-prolyl cis-trans isomerase/HEAT repeat protein
VLRKRPSAIRLAWIAAACLAASAARAADLPPETARRIAIAEDQRRFAPDLEGALADPEAAVRARAALAVGRLQDSTTVAALRRLLEDPATEVRREAVFALGQIGHRSARVALEGKLVDRDAEVVSLALEALGKLGDKAATPKVTPFLASSSAGLRATAAVALWRLADSTALEPLLARHDDPEPEVRWRVLYALEKIVAPQRVVLIAAHHLDQDADPLVRAYAVRTLGRQKSPRAVAYLLQALQDPEVAVAVNAVRALQLIADTTCVRCAGALERQLSHPHPYVRVSAATALGDRFARDATDSLGRAALADSLAAHLEDRDAATRAAVGRALLLLQGEAALSRLEPLFQDTSLVARVGLLSALRGATPRHRWLDLLRLRIDPKRPLLERVTAAEMIGARHEPGGAELLRAGLADTSMQFAAACASALDEAGDSTSVALLAKTFAARIADAEPDARIAIRDALRDLAGRAFADSLERAHPVREPAPLSYSADFATPPTAHGAVIHTSAGDIEWDFYSREAPQTVRNFVRLARRGYFDGSAFHRVVPNFVIQDGDPTGTGAGGPGYTIRCEYNRLHYAPGMVGMALSGKDTGGSQWFITHSPQLHLDGRYTIFARVVRGMDVVHRVVQGDRVLRVEILE